MKLPTLASALGAALLLGAAAAEAGTLTMATWLQQQPGVPMTRTTAQLGAAGSSTASSIAVSLSYPQLTVSFFVPKTSMGVVDQHIKITQGGPQAITATPGMAAATQGVPGTVVIMTAAHAAKGVNASMYSPGFNTLVAIPISNGQAGQLTGSFVVIGQTHVMTLDFFDWTPGTWIFTGLTSNFSALPDVVAMGSFALSAMGGGTVTLVSPSKISIDGVFAQQRTASFTTLKLSFVPEPGTLLLLGAAAAALALRYGKTR